VRIIVIFLVCKLNYFLLSQRMLFVPSIVAGPRSYYLLLECFFVKVCTDICSTAVTMLLHSTNVSYQRPPFWSKIKLEKSTNSAIVSQ
jgi:hypothetical protein